MYISLYSVLKTYWREYGGFKSFILSPFTHLAFIVALLYKLGAVNLDWRHITLSSLPTMLGFSLAAYTITFTLMGSALHRALATAIDKSSGLPLIKIVNATFFHIVTFQALALAYSLVTNGSFFYHALGGIEGWTSWREALLNIIVEGGDILGAFLSLYSFFLLFSVAFAMFRLGRLTMPPPQDQQGVNSNTPAHPQGEPQVIGTWRFAVVKFVAKTLRLYK